MGAQFYSDDMSADVASVYVISQHFFARSPFAQSASYS